MQRKRHTSAASTHVARRVAYNRECCAMQLSILLSFLQLATSVDQVWRPVPEIQCIAEVIEFIKGTQTCRMALTKHVLPKFSSPTQ